MKLNLLPTNINKGAKTRNAIIGSVLLAALGIAGMVALTTTSNDALRTAKQAEADARPKADRAVATALQADEVIAQAKGILTNSALSEAVLKHSATYPAFYDQLLPQIPSYFRVTQITATPSSADSVTVNIQGVLDTYQQYADLMIGLLRIAKLGPDGKPMVDPATKKPMYLVQTVGRNGYIDRSMIVPALTPDDQTGRPRLPGDPTLPDNEFDRLALYEAKAAVQRFDATGGFGDPTVVLKGAGPDSSLISVTIVMSGTLQVPDVTNTLRAAISATPAAPAATPGAGAPAGGAPAAGAGRAAGAGAAGRTGAGDVD
jgi:hypothetical protein